IQDDFIQSNSSLIHRKIEKNKSKLSDKLTNEEIGLFCQLQTKITQLKLEIQKKLDNVNQTFHIDNRTINQQIKNIQGFNIEGSNNTLTSPSVQGNTLETITYEEENIDAELQATTEMPLKNKQLN
ncbi:8366_t:CDS:1, partial [Funneliformis geosporum]